MAIVVTRPVSAPTNLQSSLVAGGSLAASTQYYYVMFAYNQLYSTPSTAPMEEDHIIVI